VNRFASASRLRKQHRSGFRIRPAAARCRRSSSSTRRAAASRATSVRWRRGSRWSTRPSGAL